MPNSSIYKRFQQLQNSQKPLRTHKNQAVLNEADFEEHLMKRIKVEIRIPVYTKFQNKCVFVDMPSIKRLGDQEEITKLTKEFLLECTEKLKLDRPLKHMFRLVKNNEIAVSSTNVGI